MHLKNSVIIDLKRIVSNSSLIFISCVYSNSKWQKTSKNRMPYAITYHTLLLAQPTSVKVTFFLTYFYVK